MLVAFGCALHKHRWAVLVTWGIVLLVCLPVAPRVFRALTAGGFTSPDLEAFRATQLLADRFESNPSNLVLVFEHPTLRADDPRFLQEVDASLAEVRALPFIERVVTAETNPRQIAPDGGAQYVTINLTSHTDDLRDVVPAIEHTLKPAALQV